MSLERVVVTGAGIVSAIGMGKENTLRALENGQSGIGSVQYLLTSHTEYPMGEVKHSNEEMRQQLGISPLAYENRTSLLGILAIQEALEEAVIGSRKLALTSGTTVGGMDQTELHYPDALTVEDLNRHDCGATTNLMADYFGNFDFTTTLSTACSSALNAIILAARLIECGRRDIIVAGGSECLTRFHLNGFKSLMILDEQPCRPFDATRAGLNLGEGAGFLILESETSARQRGARILAVLSGCGNRCDAFHQTASSETGDGAYLSMTDALKEAGLTPGDVDYVNAHGTGTPNNDASESEALRRVFGVNLPPVSSTKGFTGHTTSASGGIEAVISLLSLLHQFIPRNIGWEQRDENCIVPYVQQEMPQHPIRNVLCNSFGFGGNDSSLILSRYGE